MKVYITGDTHVQFGHIKNFCRETRTTKEDILIILGDSGINYNVLNLETENRPDIYRYKDSQFSLDLKFGLSKLPITLFCIQGNHEAPAHLVDGYFLSQQSHPLFSGQNVFTQEQFPNILFAEEGCIYKILGKTVGIIGGAYSVDKSFRLYRGYPWFKEEQPSTMKSDKVFVEHLKENLNKLDIILSHTCPFHYMPTEAFLPGLNQEDIDNSTEKFLEEIEKNIEYKMWFCGHFHIDKNVDKLSFLFKDIIELEV